MPYGGRPREQMRTIARQNIAFAESFNVKVILAACGTISSNAPDIIAANETKTIGVLLPGAERLAATGRKELGVIATKTSIESGAFQLGVSRFAPDAKITAVACPDFVPMIESGHYLPDDPMVQRIVAQSLEPLKDVGALLLGCTHYGLIARRDKRVSRKRRRPCRGGGRFCGNDGALSARLRHARIRRRQRELLHKRQHGRF